MNVRGFRLTDTAVLTPTHRNLFPARLRQGNGRIWIIANERDTAVGYALTLPVPGLPGLLELDGRILPQYQRRGYGRHLLQRLIQDLAKTGTWQLSHSVSDTNSPAAHFLRACGFFIEHEEWTLVNEQLAMNNEQTEFDNCSLFIANWETAVTTFLTLYNKAFSPHPWYQPFTPAEVKATLASPADLLFLHSPLATRHSSLPIGFAWLRLDDTVGEIEPIGIVPKWQGKGYGRILLTATLQQLAQRGAATVKITAWRSNSAAIHLYQSLGFRHTHTHTYLAYNLPQD
ncbi:MAG: GNAT family N-acetyltransferase [Ardenticatenaceae bacterium]|nr:GNAT family N-acetyltransferase [Ardenticatenaceae bacterium]MCB8990293.1 GNAT family N-acetyltransferase [Ardenticatenaceae bacterium]